MAVCLKLQIHLPGLVQLPKKFKIIRRRKEREYLDESKNSVTFNEDIVNDNPINLAPECEILPKKRGRKPKHVAIDNNCVNF